MRSGQPRHDEPAPKGVTAPPFGYSPRHTQHRLETSPRRPEQTFTHDLDPDASSNFAARRQSRPWRTTRSRYRPCYVDHHHPRPHSPRRRAHAQITISRDLRREALAEGAGELLLIDHDDAEMRLWLDDRESPIAKATIALPASSRHHRPGGLSDFLCIRS